MTNRPRSKPGFTALHIRIYVNELADHAMFVTRDCLIYGTRNAVDITLSRMVKAGIIMRLTNGVFLKVNPILKLNLPTALEVAKAKARAFGKMIFEHGAYLAKKLSLVEEENPGPTFITDGPSSSFLYGETRIYFRAAAPRKVNLMTAKQGSLLNALWFAGRRRINWSTLPSATRYLGRIERHQLRQEMHLMPTWLSEFFSPLEKVLHDKTPDKCFASIVH